MIREAVCIALALSCSSETPVLDAWAPSDLSLIRLRDCTISTSIEIDPFGNDIMGIMQCANEGRDSGQEGPIDEGVGESANETISEPSPMVQECDRSNVTVASALGVALGCAQARSDCLVGAISDQPSESSGLANYWTSDAQTRSTCSWIPAAAPAAPLPPTDGQVADLMERRLVPFEVPVAGSNPPSPACVVLNLDNYFYAQVPGTAPLTVMVVGVPVTIYPQVRGYQFDFGDGTVLDSQDPGGPYPDGTVIHRYVTPGHYQARVSIIWGAEWEAAGVARRPVPGTATTVSAPIEVWAHEYRIKLVADPNWRPAGQDVAGDPCLTGN